MKEKNVPGLKGKGFSLNAEKIRRPDGGRKSDVKRYSGILALAGMGAFYPGQDS